MCPSFFSTEFCQIFITLLFKRNYVKFYSFSQLPTNTEEDVIDRNVLAKERQQDAVEDDFMDDDCEILNSPSKTKVLFDDEILTDDINNQFLTTNYRGSVILTFHIICVYGNTAEQRLRMRHLY